MKQQMEMLHKELIKVKKQRDCLDYKVNEMIKKQSFTLNQCDHDDLKKMVLSEDNTITHQTTLQKVFWEQQVDALKKSDSRGMKWYPLMIRLCIIIWHQSQSAYETMRRCIQLPSQRTLCDYTHYTKAQPGFSAEIDAQLCSAAKIHQCEEKEKNVILLLDEMHIREDWFLTNILVKIIPNNQT